MARSELHIASEDPHHWKVMEVFRAALLGAVQEKELHPGFQDPDRRLKHADYLSLFLFGLFNPILKTMRALCAASQLKRVQEEVCQRPVSLGAFSEAQHLVDPAHLEKVFKELCSQLPPRGPPPPNWPGNNCFPGIVRCSQPCRGWLGRCMAEGTRGLPIGRCAYISISMSWKINRSEEHTPELQS